MRKKQIKIGCCGFAVSRKRYFHDFSVVEVQQTFYEPPSESTLKQWRIEAPEGFEFTIKAWQIITHPFTSPTYKRTKSCIGNPENYGFFKNTQEVYEAWKTTLKVAEILQSNIILFQTPSSFKPDKDNIENMKKFFDYIDREDLTFVLELRGWQWNQILTVTEATATVPVITEEHLYNDIPAELYYLRLHGRQGYKYKYADTDLKQIYQRVLELDRSVYVLFNNIHMYDDAMRLKKMIE